MREREWGKRRARSVPRDFGSAKSLWHASSHAFKFAPSINCNAEQQSTASPRPSWAELSEDPCDVDLVGDFGEASDPHMVFGDFGEGAPEPHKKESTAAPEPYMVFGDFGAEPDEEPASENEQQIYERPITPPWERLVRGYQEEESESWERQESHESPQQYGSHWDSRTSRSACKGSWKGDKWWQQGQSSHFERPRLTSNNSHFQHNSGDWHSASSCNNWKDNWCYDSWWNSSSGKWSGKGKTAQNTSATWWSHRDRESAW